MSMNLKDEWHRRAEAGDRETSKSGEDSQSLYDEKKRDGLTLKQAAVIYFGGFALLIGGILVAELAT